MGVPGRVHLLPDFSMREVYLLDKTEHLKELHNLRFENEKLARELAARELARRLDDLNHAHAQAVEVQQTYVTKDVYERDLSEVKEKLEELRIWKGGITGQIALLGGIATFLNLALGIVLHFWH